jgi:hypothetical protein
MPNEVGVDELARPGRSLTNRGSEPLPTVEQAEDAAASALARLIWDGLHRRGWDDRDGLFLSDFVTACRELLRGPLADDGTRRPGGYCMKAPTDPTLWALGRFGAQLVEISYQVRNVPRALDEFEALLEEFRRVALS